MSSADIKRPAATAATAAVSVVVCIRNGEAVIARCLQNILVNHPYEIIVVDGRSQDRTLDIVRGFAGVRVLSDEGRGLASARRIGVEACTGTHVLFVGPDNLLPPTFVADFVRLMDEWKFDAASVQTRVAPPLNYWDRGVDFRWQCLMATPGPVSVVGTPSLYKRELFDAVTFDDSVDSADDTDLSERLRAAGYHLGLLPLAVYEFGANCLRDCWGRYRFYGLGDHRYFRKYAPGWGWRRKLSSLSHPLRQTSRFSLKAVKSGRLNVIPVLWMLMAARYWGWLKAQF